MIRTNVFLSEEHREQLAKLAEQTNLPAAEHVRRALKLYLCLVDGQLADVLAEAYKTFPDVSAAGDDDSQAIIRALRHWLHNRQANSIRGSLRRIETHLGIEQPEEEDVPENLH